MSASSVNTSKVRTNQSDLQKGNAPRAAQTMRAPPCCAVVRSSTLGQASRHRGTPRSSTPDWTSEIRGWMRSLFRCGGSRQRHCATGSSRVPSRAGHSLDLSSPIQQRSASNSRIQVRGCTVSTPCTGMNKRPRATRTGLCALGQEQPIERGSL